MPPFPTLGETFAAAGRGLAARPFRQLWIAAVTGCVALPFLIGLGSGGWLFSAYGLSRFGTGSSAELEIAYLAAFAVVLLVIAALQRGVTTSLVLAALRDPTFDARRTVSDAIGRWPRQLGVEGVRLVTENLVGGIVGVVCAMSLEGSVDWGLLAPIGYAIYAAVATGLRTIVGPLAAVVQTAPFGEAVRTSAAFGPGEHRAFLKVRAAFAVLAPVVLYGSPEALDRLITNRAFIDLVTRLHIHSSLVFVFRQLAFYFVVYLLFVHDAAIDAAFHALRGRTPKPKNVANVFA